MHACNEVGEARLRPHTEAVDCCHLFWLKLTKYNIPVS